MNRIFAIAFSVIVVPAAIAQAGPNFLLVSLDTVRADHCSVYGYSRDTTPNLEALARQGILFELAYAPTATTAPSHSTMFTALYPITHGVVKNGIELDQKFLTIAEVLQGAGYQTGAVTSSFVLDRRFGYAQGFDDFMDEIPPGGASVEAGEWQGYTVEHGFDRRANNTTTTAIEWLREKRDDSRPFFLFVHYFEPHDPYVPPAPYDTRYPTSEDAESLDQDIAQYDGSIRFTDDELGRLLIYMKRRGMLDDTVIVVVGDHGEGLMDHGEMYHGNDVFDESVRVPLIYWDGRNRTEGRRVPGPVELTDIAPTIAALAAVSFPATNPGVDQSGVLSGEANGDLSRPAYLHRRHYSADDPNNKGHVGERFGIYHEQWKYITGEGEGPAELYDIANDPKERADVAAENPDKAAALRESLQQWLNAYMREDTEITALPDETREALEALGYIE